jgi:hypothetical protein
MSLSRRAPLLPISAAILLIFAGRNGSIWPSLASATLYNLVMCLVLL